MKKMNSGIPYHLIWTIDKLGIKEKPKGSNRGVVIDKWEKRFGLLGEPWCAMFASIATKKGKVRVPKIWSARALSFYDERYAVGLKQVQLGHYKPKAGDYLVFDYGAGFGHVDIVDDYDVDTDTWTLIGGNRDDAVRAVKMTTNQIRSKGGVAVIEVLSE
jgi:hypothetical protein